MSEKLRSIQVLRGFAAIAVVLIHATASPAQISSGGKIFYWGAAGVDLFFVISGFIMGSIAPGQTPGEFIYRRLWRIYPLWWVASAPWLIAIGGSYLVNFTLWPVWGSGYILPSPSLGWTLGFELLFYAGMTVAMLTRPAVPFAVLAGALILQPFTDSAALDFLGNPMILEFLFGLAITRLPRDPRFGLGLVALGLAILAVAPVPLYDGISTLQPKWAALRVIFWGFPCALVVYGFLAIEPAFAGRGWNIPVFMGDASYSVYLFHIVVTHASPLPWAINFLAGIALGIVVHLALERRLMRMRPRLNLNQRERLENILLLHRRCNAEDQPDPNLVEASAARSR